MVKTEQIFKGNILDVKQLVTEKMKKLRNEENFDKNEFTIVTVSGLPKGCTWDSVLFHFQNRKNGGGEIRKLVMSEGTARVTFQDPHGGFYCISYLLL